MRDLYTGDSFIHVNFPYKRGTSTLLLELFLCPTDSQSNSCQRSIFWGGILGSPTKLNHYHANNNYKQSLGGNFPCVIGQISLKNRGQSSSHTKGLGLGLT